MTSTTTIYIIIIHPSIHYLNPLPLFRVTVSWEEILQLLHRPQLHYY